MVVPTSVRQKQINLHLRALVRIPLGSILYPSRYPISRQQLFVKKITMEASIFLKNKQLPVQSTHKLPQAPTDLYMLFVQAFQS